MFIIIKTQRHKTENNKDEEVKKTNKKNSDGKSRYHLRYPQHSTHSDPLYLHTHILKNGGKTPLITLQLQKYKTEGETEQC